MDERETIYVEDLVIGEEYIQRNPYHHEYEYGTVWYAGEIENKYGDTCYLFSEEPLPDDYDGEPSSWNIGGPFFEYDDIYNGCICR